VSLGDLLAEATLVDWTSVSGTRTVTRASLGSHTFLSLVTDTAEWITQVGTRPLRAACLKRKILAIEEA
jgi:hypothetical protein